MIGSDPYSFRELWRHYRTCRQGKRNTRNALAFEVDAEAELFELQAELREHRYRPGRSTCFVTGGPKPREVFAADFRDRVVHHLLVASQEKAYERIFIHDSFACRRGKGTLAASDRLMVFLRRATANGKRRAFALKLDVASFFPTIDKARLEAILTRRFRDPEVRWLTRTVLFHDPTQGYRFQARNGRTSPPETPGYVVPAHKSLFGKLNARGLPIGNLTSQFWANVYLNEVDHFVKRELRVKHYLRYVDDMVLVGEDATQLAAWGREIERFLGERLGLSLRRDQAVPVPVARGIDFVGWKTWWNRRVPRRRTLGSLRNRVLRFEQAAVRPASGGRARVVDLRTRRGRGMEGLRASLASYSGHLRHGAARADWERLFQDHPWLGLVFDSRGWKLDARWPRGRAAPDFGQQYMTLTRWAGSRCLVFCRVGRFIEFFGPQRLLAQAALGLRPAVVPRASFHFAAGFPVALAGIYRARALEAGHAVAEVHEFERLADGLPRRREVVRAWLPVAPSPLEASSNP